MKWIDVGESRSVAIQNRKGGFTCTVLANAAGDLNLLQFIFRGTSRMFVDVEHSDRVLQCARTGSHFQDSSTWAEFLERFLDIVGVERSKLSDVNTPALFIIDGATQHKDSATALSSKSCQCVEIPPKMTHVFQPADQFVISGLKVKARALFNGYVARIFARQNVEDAVHEMVMSSASHLRTQKVTLITKAMREITRAQVIASWKVTGITAALFDETERCTPTRADAYASLLTDSERETVSRHGDELQEMHVNVNVDEIEPPEDQDIRQENIQHIVSLQSKKRGRPPNPSLSERLESNRIEKEKKN